jgi:hypothetical protein
LQIRLPQPDELALRYGEIKPLLKKATDRAGGSYLPIDVLREMFLGQVGIWLVEDGDALVGLAVAAARQFPQQRVIHISFVAGRRLEEWWPLFVDEMDKFARASKATAIYAYGRPGWVRFWKARGVAQHVASEMMVRRIVE